MMKMPDVTFCGIFMIRSMQMKQAQDEIRNGDDEHRREIVFEQFVEDWATMSERLQRQTQEETHVSQSQDDLGIL